jgi:antitoxin VapB
MLTIDDPEIERFLREEAERTGAAPVEVLRRFLPRPLSPPRDRATQVSPQEQARRMAVIREIQQELAALPRLDDRPMDEILGYDENGLPG